MGKKKKKQTKNNSSDFRKKGRRGINSHLSVPEKWGDKTTNPTPPGGEENVTSAIPHPILTLEKGEELIDRKSVV